MTPLCHFPTPELRDGLHYSTCTQCHREMSSLAPGRWERKCRAADEAGVGLGDRATYRCQFLGEKVGRVKCRACGVAKYQDLLGCSEHGTCTLSVMIHKVACCVTCEQYIADKP